MNYLKEAAKEMGDSSGCGGDGSSDGSGKDNNDGDGGSNGNSNGDGDCHCLMDAMVKVCPCWPLAQGWRHWPK